MNLTTHLQLISRLRISRAKPLILPAYAFMVWAGPLLPLYTDIHNKGKTWTEYQGMPKQLRWNYTNAMSTELSTMKPFNIGIVMFWVQHRVVWYQRFGVTNCFHLHGTSPWSCQSTCSFLHFKTLESHPQCESLTPWLPRLILLSCSL